MRRFLLALVFVFAASAGLSAGEIKIAWYGQSMFLIVTPKGTRIVLDPHNLESYRQVTPLKADLILMSHLHNDHTRLEQVENAKDAKQVNALKSSGPDNAVVDWNEVDEKFKDVRYQSIPTYHDAASGLTRGKNGCWIIDIDGIRIAHLGDLGHLLKPAQIKKFGKVDVVMVPAGGVYTINGIDAFKVAQQLKPSRHILPMHYGTIVYDDLLPLKYFTDEAKDAGVPVVTFKARGWLKIDTAVAPKAADVVVLNFLGAPLEFVPKKKK